MPERKLTVGLQGRMERWLYYSWACSCGRTGVLLESMEAAKREADEHECVVRCERCKRTLRESQLALSPCSPPTWCGVYGAREKRD